MKSVKHEEDDVSEVTLSDGSVLFAKMVLDATGHARKLVDFEREFTPGYQAAFGIVCDVESHPFPLDTMLFMDWRDDHLDDAYKSVNDILPTFLYAMPFSNTQVFLEETSLVARPGLEFDDLKVKLKQRLERLGVKVTKVEEEEYCLIPMGGVLPTFPQRTLGIGGTAGMVHPSTGFMVAKTMRSANVLVDDLRGVENGQIWHGCRRFSRRIHSSQRFYFIFCKIRLRKHLEKSMDRRRFARSNVYVFRHGNVDGVGYQRHFRNFSKRFSIYPQTFGAGFSAGTSVPPVCSP